MLSRIYLAGPIAGLTYDDSENWRNYVISKMPKNIICYSPMRRKQFLRAHGKIGLKDGLGGEGNDTYDEHGALASSRGIMSRDHNDCKNADLILCNLIGAKTVSIGTVMEIAWSFSYRIPLVVCMEEKNNLHDHPMVREAISFRAYSIDEGIEYTKAILLP